MKKFLLYFFLFYPFNLFGIDMVSINGKVTSESGQELVGANVLVLGTTIGAASDGDGYYELGIIKSSLAADIIVLKASYIGYESKIDTILIDELHGSLLSIDFSLPADVMQ